jgi:hypothetical protein
VEISVNKVVSGGFDGRRCSGGSLLFLHRGGAREEVRLLAVRGWSPHPQQGSMMASSLRTSTAPLSPYLMVERRPLHP